MAAQYLPRGLLLPSSGLKNWLKKKKNEKGAVEKQRRDQRVQHL